MNVYHLLGHQRTDFVFLQRVFNEERVSFFCSIFSERERETEEQSLAGPMRLLEQQASWWLRLCLSRRLPTGQRFRFAVSTYTRLQINALELCAGINRPQWKGRRTHS